MIFCTRITSFSTVRIFTPFTPISTLFRIAIYFFWINDFFGRAIFVRIFETFSISTIRSNTTGFWTCGIRGPFTPRFLRDFKIYKNSLINRTKDILRENYLKSRRSHKCFNEIQFWDNGCLYFHQQLTPNIQLMVFWDVKSNPRVDFGIPK